MVIGLTGTVWVPILVTPRFVHLNGLLGDIPERTITLEAQKEAPLALELKSVSIPDKIDVELIEMEKGKSYQARIKNKVKGQAISYHGDIVFKTNYPDTPDLRIRVAGNIKSTVEARPKSLNFGKIGQQQIDKLKKKKRAMTRPVMVILNKGTDLQVKKVDMDKGLFTATVKPLQNGRMAQVIVEADFDKLKNGINEDMLEIYTNQKGYEVFKIPVRFQIQ